MASFEVGGYDGPVLLLSSSIPDVQLGRFLLQVDIFDFEVDGGDLCIFLSQEISFCKSPEKSSLANVAIPDDDYFIPFLIFVGWKVAIFNHVFLKLQSTLFY